MDAKTFIDGLMSGEIRPRLANDLRYIPGRQIEDGVVSRFARASDLLDGDGAPQMRLARAYECLTALRFRAPESLPSWFDWDRLPDSRPPDHYASGEPPRSDYEITPLGISDEECQERMDEVRRWAAMATAAE